MPITIHNNSDPGSRPPAPEPPPTAAGVRYAKIILGCLATALLVLMGLTVVKALRANRLDAPLAAPPRRAAAGDNSAWETLNLRTVSGPHFTVGFSPRAGKADAEAVLGILDAARADLARRLNGSGLSVDGVPRLEIVLHESTGDFTAATGQPWWAAAATKERRIELQPVEVLRNRGVLETTLRHEYAHAVIESLGHGRTPRWLAEGLAITLAGEGPRYAHSGPKTQPTPAEIESQFMCDSPGPCPPTPAASAQAYAAAYQAVQKLIREKTELAVWKTVAGS